MGGCKNNNIIFNGDDVRDGDGSGVVNICEFTPIWKDLFSKEAQAIKLLGMHAKIYVDHVGSTAVEGVAAKPIIDILISVCDWSLIESVLSELKKIGYTISEKCDVTPRIFLTKYISDVENYHVHVCKPQSRWGRDMVAFRNELAADRKFADDYITLKKRLAKKYCCDVPSYTLGKKDLIETRLRKIKSEFGVNGLLTLQRTESNRAEFLQLCMMFTQFLIAVVAAISVYSNDNKYLFLLAIFGFVCMLFLLFLSKNQQRHRAAGDQARRAVLLISGLDMEPSAEQRLRIRDSFSLPISNNNLRREEDHFSSREVPSYKRLSEMVEESSYWTGDLQRTSARAMTGMLFFLAAIVSITIGAAVASLESDGLISLSRAMIAIIIFIISSDSLGLLLAYRSSAVAIGEVFKRVESTAARGYLESDVLLLMSDYNAAVEKAPSPLPWVYRFRQERLSRRWQEYVDAKLSGSVSG
ncbi:GrpB family protein [Achromobacter xylosoxidans]|jgi:GrpB-like predicted nucleotidyltransferase (UPF0157 family)